MKKPLLTMFFVAIMSVIVYAADRCIQCGMRVDEAKRQYFVVTTKDGKKQKTCNQGCAVIFMENIKGEVKSVEAVDYNTGKTIRARDAFYVKGSNVKPVMGGESVVSFSKKEDAERFQKEQGGRLMTYDELFEAAEEEHKGHRH
jgi:nitrous oxide reductase accessory protein NosL